MPSATDAAKTLIPHGPFQYPPTQGPKHTTSRLAAPLKPITSSSAKGRHYRILPLDKQGCAGSGAPFTTQRNATQRSAPDRGGGTAQVYPTFVSPSFCIRCSGAGYNTMHLLPFALIAAQVAATLARPLEARHRAFNAVKNGATKTKALTSAAASPSATAPPANAEGDKNELEIEGKFGTAVALGGGDIKTDVLFPKGTVGVFEVEFQDKNANTVTVTENKTPGFAPAGFKFLDPSSYKVALGKSADNLTLQKIDFIFDAILPALKDVDTSKSRVGKLCTETNTFVISEALGEEEFEVEENEVTLTVKSLNGEWAVFIPTAQAATGDAKEEKDETIIESTFDKATATPAGNKKTDILFPANAAGQFEVEVNATAANAITVKTNPNPVAPPKGFLFVDPVSYQISTSSKTSTATDKVKVDYFFSAAVRAAADIKQGVIGKLDAASGQFVVDVKALGAGFEFEVEDEENEWTLTVPDLNGEWAILIPQAAVLKGPTTLTI
ncbi:hypothetical protein JR316_0011916 [Psilocybe cubensis]|uniref:Uncharacterized protein n=2 Tax=Psilocybe cubensis TaxID=181762 RepID=A0ACB8GLC2_PSICU|nr:hypothetical protein JR316_0011916 [Psilocybe cubensis]KAH9476341.1 hypothetical protein JR316_0011916 [Psilocybe cubensis]